MEASSTEKTLIVWREIKGMNLESDGMTTDAVIGGNGFHLG